MFKGFLAWLLVCVLFGGVAYIGVMQIPDAEMFVDAKGRCLIVKVIGPDGWEKVPCSEFDTTRKYKKTYGDPEHYR